MLRWLLIAGVLGGGAYWYLSKNRGSGQSGSFNFLENIMGGTPRGIRNNNPGNIKWNSVNNWTGQTGQDEQGFAVFSDAKYGIRAMNKLLNTYALTGRNTARKIIESWTHGDASNIQQNYMLKIEQETGKSRDAVLGDADRLKLIKAIIYFENGQNPYSDSFIQSSMVIA